RVRIVPLAAKERIDAAVRQVYAGLSARPGPESAAEAGPPARHLAAMVLGPVAQLLAGHQRIVVVPDGALSFWPLAALPSPDARGGWLGRPMIADHEIVYLPSASVLSALRERRGARPSAENSLAVLADPVFSREDPRLRSGTRTPGGGVASGPPAA